MSHSSHNFTQPWSLEPGEDYWVYLPGNIRSHPPLVGALPRNIPNPRRHAYDPSRLFEDRLVGGPSGIVRYPLATPLGQLPILDDTSRNYTYQTHRQPARPPPRRVESWTPNQTSAQDSKLTPEEQNQALNKLRKQLYNPHLSKIVQRLTMKYKDNGTGQSNESGATSSNDDDGKRCAVCLEDFESKQFVMLTPCNHMFHEECIVPWIKSQGKCPVCRFVLCEPNSSRPTPPRPSGQGNMTRDMLDEDLITIIRAFDRAF